MSISDNNLTNTLTAKINLSHKHILADSFWPSCRALLASHLLKTFNKTVIWIIENPITMACLKEDIPYFTTHMSLSFPAWDFEIDEKIEPSPEVTSQRINTIYSLSKNHSVVFTSLEALRQKTLSKEHLKDKSILIKVGDNLSLNWLVELLLEIGYEQSHIVKSVNSFCIRSGILDIFPVASQHPIRVVFFGDEIENIKTFDINTQKSLSTITETQLLPAKEKLENTQLISFLDNMCEDYIILVDNMEELEEKAVSSKKSYTNEQFYSDPMEAIKQNSTVFCTDHIDSYNTSISGQKAVFDFCNTSIEGIYARCPFSKIEDFSDPNGNQPHFFSGLENIISAGYKITLLSSSQIETKKLAEAIPEINNIPTQITYLSSSIIDINHQYALVSTVDIAKKTRIHRASNTSSFDTWDHDTLFEEGDLVVHVLNGIGVYRGITKKTDLKGNQSEFIEIEYSENSKLYVPLHQVHMICKYESVGDTQPKLDTIGSSRWKKAKEKAESSIRKYANDLLKLYAQRSICQNDICPDDSDKTQSFDLSFPYCLTIDQKTCLEDIKEDLCSPKVMDRLICGDVGFGKTEVAMRAAFKTVVDGNKQVAVLVPTTVLSSQHYECFVSRMNDFGIRICQVSRLIDNQTNKKNLKKISNGEIDIVIGTHRLISDDVSFKSLGLVIIDEEQRFGVRAKEKIKMSVTNVNCLTLSATPIPRTFYMSLIGARDLSLIQTPPQDRLPIATYITKFSEEVIVNAITKELNRGGQVYVINNKIEHIYSFANFIKQLVPNVKLSVVHGKMDIEDIDKTFMEFKNGKFNVIVSTTILEHGIDIPNANTIIINNAHCFGLSDLYQLRGRVGRWDKKAFAYLLIPDQITDDGVKRLSAFNSACKAGGGMKIAMEDLQIRGCGDILGTEQSGQVCKIGFNLYCKMLKRALSIVSGNKNISEKDHSEVSIKIDLPYCMPCIDENYINDISLRLSISKRLGECTEPFQVDEINQEISDRFGSPMPDGMKWLIAITKISIIANDKRVTGIKLAYIDKNKSVLNIQKKKGATLYCDQTTINTPQSPDSLLDILLIHL